MGWIIIAMLAVTIVLCGMVAWHSLAYLFGCIMDACSDD